MIVKDKEIAVKDKKIKSLTIETEKGDRLFVQLNELLKLQKDKISVLTKLNKSNDVV
jgi:hypothetical protein